MRHDDQVSALQLRLDAGTKSSQRPRLCVNSCQRRRALQANELETGVGDFPTGTGAEKTGKMQNEV